MNERGRTFTIEDICIKINMFKKEKENCTLHKILTHNMCANTLSGGKKKWRGRFHNSKDGRNPGFMMMILMIIIIITISS